MSTGNTLFWAGALLIGAMLLAPNLPDAPSPSKAAPAPVEAPQGSDVEPPESAGTGLASRELTRDADGHFYADARVNGARIRFLVDTGASMVALTPEDARRAGIAVGDTRGRAIGAGGEIEVAPVMIDRIAIGPLETRDVRGAVVEELPVSLLGQSFLDRVGSVEISGDTMVLR